MPLSKLPQFLFSVKSDIQDQKQQHNLQQTQHKGFPRPSTEGIQSFSIKVLTLSDFFWEKATIHKGKKCKERTKFQAEPGLHGLSFRQKWREYAQNMLLLIAERLLPRDGRKIYRKIDMHEFFGGKGKGQKIPSHFSNKNSDKYIKIMQWLTDSSFSRWCRLQTFETLNHSFFLIFVLSRQCFTEHLLHSTMKLYIFVLLAVFI